MVNINKVREIAKSKGFVIKKIQAEMGYSEAFFGDVAKGKTSMSDQQTEWLAHRLGTSFEYLTDLTDNPEPFTSKPGQFNHNRFLTLCMNVPVLEEHALNEIGISKDRMERVRLRLEFLTDSEINSIARYFNTSYAYLTNQTDNSQFYGCIVIPTPEETHRKKEQRWAARRIASLMSAPKFNYNRFNERRIARHLTPDYVEAQLNLPEDYWEDVRDGYVIPDTQLINKLAILLETTYDYLMGLTDNPEIPLDDRTGVKIKLFGEVAAGIPIKQIDNFDPDDESSWEEINRSTAKNGTYFALRIKGDSMATRIQNGDRVIVRYQETVESGQTAVVAINGDTATCKKVIWDEQGGMILMSNNPAYPPRYFTAEQIQKLPVRILGRVVEIRGEP